MTDVFLNELDSSFETFRTYFPNEREDIDIIVLRGHQLIESLLYQFLKQNVNNPSYVDNFFISWEPLVSLVRSIKTDDEEEYNWVWRAIIRLAKTRNQIAHNINPVEQKRHSIDFINCVKSYVNDFQSISGENELKKAIFIVYCNLATALALNEFPNCTATALARKDIKDHLENTLNQGIK